MPTCIAAECSTDPTTFVAVDAVSEAVRRTLAGPADAAVLLVTGHHADALERIVPALAEQLQTDNLIGCTVETALHNEREYEDSPALSLWAGRWDSGTVRRISLKFENTPDGPVIDGDSQLTDASGTLILLGEPFTFPADLLLERMRESAPRLQILGGMASAAHLPGQNRLIAGASVAKQGAVGLLFDESIPIRAVVSQGCRPIGERRIVTRSERNIIQELGGRPASAFLREVFASLTPEDQARARRGLHVGRVMSEYRDEFGPGDFLIRNVVGVDPETGAVAIGDFVRVGQTVQFHLRDAETADQELRNLLTDNRDSAARGALLFTCNGRGTRLFAQPHHDAGMLQELLGAIPTAGFFAAGEIGPVAGVNYLHGFTAAVALFC